MPDFVENMWDCGIATVDGWQNTYQLCWVNACNFDGIKPDSPFVVFSENNPIVPHYEKARRKYWEEKQNLNACGYVGLVMNLRLVPKLKMPKKKRTK